MKIPACIPVSVVLLALASCGGSGGPVSGEKESPAVNEKSAGESAKDYMMNPVRQKKKAVKALDKALAKRDSDISRQLEEAAKR